MTFDGEIVAQQKFRGATSGRWTSNFWLDQAVFVHLPEVNKQPPLKSKRAEIVKIVLNENEPCLNWELLDATKSPGYYPRLCSE